MPNTRTIVIKKSDHESVTAKLSEAISLIGDIAQTTPLPEGMAEGEASVAQVAILAWFIEGAAENFKAAAHGVSSLRDAASDLADVKFVVKEEK